jgi:formylglycine-generating enzyme required for sulfatase activity
MTTPRIVRIFLSSPGDVAAERMLAQKVIDQLAYRPALRGRVFFEIIAWDKPGAGTPMLANMTPQEAINQGLPKPSECDIAVVIFWARMGTPLPEDYQKPDGSRYQSGTEWEYLDALTAAQSTGLPLTVVYRRTDVPEIKLNDPDRKSKMDQYDRVEAFFASFVNSDGSIRQGHNAYANPDEFRELFDLHLEALVLRLLDGKTSKLPAAADEKLPLWEGSPFPGLRSFDVEDASVFFGRGQEIDAVVQQLHRTRFLAIVSASGSGKSSLIRAGVIPRLQANAILGSKDWHLLSFSPGEIDNNPFMALAVQFSKVVKQSVRSLATSLQTEPTRFEDCVAALLKGQPEWAECLLFIDQFEELFISATVEMQIAFIELLHGASQNQHVRILITVRADFYPQAVQQPVLAILLRGNTFPLSTPSSLNLYEMIIKPAERAGLTLEKGLADRIVQDTGTEPGALALMAYTLDELYKVSEQRKLTFESYLKLGGVQGAIGKRAEAIFTALSSDRQNELTKVFSSLVELDIHGSPVRRRAVLDTIAPTPEARQLILALAEARLLVQSEQNSQTTVEVAHEAIFRGWPRLSDWIEERREDLSLLRQLRVAAADWQAHGQPLTYLWPDERLQIVYPMLKRLQVKLEANELEFIRSEQERLLQQIAEQSASHFRLARIGDRLAEIGAFVKGTGLRDDNLPDIEWCEIPYGKVLINDQQFDVSPCSISRYPVSYQQYLVFLTAAEGYQNPEWWQDLGRFDSQPGTQSRSLLNHPADNVSWFDAVAFCRWLTVQFRSGQLISETSEVRLPTEWEWQYAATGANPDYVYPWGTSWDEIAANTSESGLSRTVAVGLYLRGESPFGVQDMCGNVFEWCLNEYKELHHIGISGNEQRVLRGGSWNLNRHFANNHCREIFYPPFDRSNDIGFRLCLASLKI